jgi:adenosine phosphosulfate reductase beta subunit
MPSYVNPDKCDGCKALDKTACQYICPNDLMVLNKATMKAYNQDVSMCWECYNCVKICPTQAVEIRSYADFVPLGASATPMRSTDAILWTVKFRNGTIKRFKFPIRTTPEGKAVPARWDFRCARTSFTCSNRKPRWWPWAAPCTCSSLAARAKAWGAPGIHHGLGMLDVMEGKGPISMRTEEAIQAIAEAYKGDEKAYKKKMRELESEAWEDFLDMTISQALLWAATNLQPEERSSEIAAAEPYFIGSHSGASGAWISRPEDLQTAETKGQYFWGYAHMSTVKGLFCAGDASGASSHKFSSGSHAEGRIAAKAAIKFIVENNTMPVLEPAALEALKTEILKPIDIFEQFQKATTDPEVNPNYIKPRMFMFRLQKIMGEYAGGITAQFTTNETLLKKALELLAYLKEDSEKLAARRASKRCSTGRAARAARACPGMRERRVSRARSRRIEAAAVRSQRAGHPAALPRLAEYCVDRRRALAGHRWSDSRRL